MRIPSGRYLHRYMHVLMVFIFGIIVGMSIFLLLLGGQLDELHFKIRNLEDQNVRYAEEIIDLKNTEKNMIQKQKATVREIKIHLTAPTPFIATELNQRIMHDLIFLKGRPLEQVATFHEGIILMLSGRKYRVENSVYTAQLKTLIIGQRLDLYIMVKQDIQ